MITSSCLLYGIPYDYSHYLSHVDQVCVVESCVYRCTHIFFCIGFHLSILCVSVSIAVSRNARVIEYDQFTK